MKNYFYLFTFKTLRINDTDYLAMRLLEQTSLFDLVELKLDKSNQKIIVAKDQLEFSMKRTPTKRLTQELNDAIKEAFVHLNAFKEYIHSFDSDKEETVKAAAKLIFERVDEIDWVRNRKNATNTSTEIKKLISLFETRPELVAAITLLSATNKLNNLKAALTNLDQKAKNRSDIASQNAEMSASKAAEEVKKAIKSFFEVINISLEQEANETLENLVAKINGILIDLNNSIKLRGNGKDDDTDESEDKKI